MQALEQTKHCAALRLFVQSSPLVLNQKCYPLDLDTLMWYVYVRCEVCNV